MNTDKENPSHGYTEGSDLPSAPFPQNPQVSAVQGPWSDVDSAVKNDPFYQRGAEDATNALRAKLEAAEKRVKELEEWKRQEISLWLPILEYCQNNKNAERLGIRLGDSITKRILEILKTFNLPG